MTKPTEHYLINLQDGELFSDVFITFRSTGSRKKKQNMFHHRVEGTELMKKWLYETMELDQWNEFHEVNSTKPCLWN